MKKIVSLLLSMALIIAMAPMSAITVNAETYNGTCSDNLTWEFDDSTGTLTISGNGDMNTFSDYSDVPWYNYSSFIKNVSISEGITSIGDYAFFEFINLTEIIIPDSVIDIGYCAFYGCTGLSSVTIGIGVTSIGSSAFLGCTNLKVVNNYSSLPIIKGSADYGYIGFYANSANNLKTYRNDPNWQLDINTGVLSIFGTGEMKSYYSSSDAPWYNYRSYIKHVNISDGITSIGSYTFCDYTDLKQVTIGNNVTDIGSAFYGCTGLTEVTIMNSVTYVADDAFYGCVNLKTVNNYSSWPIIKGSTNNGYIGYYAKTVNWEANINGTCGENLTWEFDESCGTLTINGSGDMTDYSHKDSVPWYNYRSFIKNVNISEGITNIGDRAFDNYADLTSVSIGNSVTSIGSSAFYNCVNLTEVTIPNSVTNISENAFYGCTNLKTVNNYSTLAIIKGSVANGYAGYYANTVNWEANINGTCGDSLNYSFEASTGKLTITGTGDMTNYSLSYSAPWSSYRTLIKSVSLPEGLTSIGSHAFKHCTNLRKITIGNSVTSIGASAFDGCTWLSEVEMSNSVESIGYWAFSGCTCLTEVTIPNSITIIDNYAFSECTNLKVVNNYSLLLIKKGNTDHGCVGYYANTVNNISAPTLYKKTNTTVILECVNNCVYSKDGVNWQENNIFDGLSPNTEYTFFQKITTADNQATYSSSLTVTTKSTFETPSVPTLFSKTDTAVTLVAITGYEYKMDNGSWQTSNIFDSLTPNSTHSFYQRVAETDTAYVSESSSALMVTTDKSTVTKPSAPTYSNKTDTTVTLTAELGYEYKMDNGSWQSGNVFTGLAPNSTHLFYRRVAETNTTYVSESSLPLSITTDKYNVTKPSAPTYSNKTDTTVTLVEKSGYEYKVNNGAWQTSNVFTGLSPATEYNFYQRVAETYTSYASESSVAAIIITDKSNTSKPSAPTLSSKTDTAVTLLNVVGYEYRMDNGAWQTSNVFGGLEPNSTHYFYQRIAATSTSYESEYSNALSVTTDKSTVAKPSAPTLSSKTDTSVTLTKKTGYEYSKDGTTWQTSTVFTGLTQNTTYSFYQRVAETNTAYASEKSNALTVTTVSSVPSTTTSTIHTVSDSTISKITAGTTVNNLLSGLSAGQYCKVYKGNSEVARTSKVGTGMVVKIMDGNTVKTSYTVIVTGDTNGDGDITITDMLAIKAHVLKKSTLSGVYATAADTSGDGGVTITDFIQVKAKILGKGNIVAR